MEANVRTQDNLKSRDPRKEEGRFHVLVNEHSLAISDETIFLLCKIQLFLNSMSYSSFLRFTYTCKLSFKE